MSPSPGHPEERSRPSSGGTLRAPASAPAPDAQAATGKIRSVLAGRGIGLVGVAPRAPSLEDVFVYKVTALERMERQP